MATVIFYEKPGCINNTKQKALLNASGHQVEAHNLLTVAWTAEALRPFFGDRPVVDWFNLTAPQIKSGEVVPSQLDAATALALMMQNPLLIRRPLMQVGDRREVGFDRERVSAWIGLEVADTARPQTADQWVQQDLQTCPNHHTTQAQSCRTP